LLYGIESDADTVDCFANNIRTTEKGTAFTIHWQGKSYDALIPLFGRTAVSNVLGCFTMACALGVAPEYIVALLASLEQIENRLYVDKQGPVTFLRDAYNSNPSGFSAALDVLKDYPGKRRILMTPGMIELGELQFSENKNIGIKAASVCDEVLVVSDVNREALVAGLTDVKDATNVHLCADRTEAFAMLAEMQQPGDIILIENDLPDILEYREVF
jgi:UDP-N-acetylmuramoyl-tripeptide--D-alanyl-D-alanine ligase